ncbi:hypothetical protein CH35J_006098 [Colletotrichum higginsianum]|uniref:Uncharacterized protein n=1 Tax=Colletotrichum higginsianum TaxID=80884 RepID=A0A4T0W3X9_9PEZI|nr:hypothetical protein CH35J_006098 [Colletotrichum higginsianum]
MAPSKKTRVAKKQQTSATGSRTKANLPKGKANAPKIRTNVPKGKARDLAKNSKSAAPPQPQDTIVVGGQKRHVIAVEDDSSDEGTIRPPKRRKGGKGPDPHDYHAVRNEAVNVLYGENTFLYLLREAAMLPATNSLGENEIVVQHPLLAEEHLSEYEGNSEDEYDDADLLPMARSMRDSEIEIDIRRYGHKFRKLMIVAEPNRTEKGYLLSMANAINVFRNLKPIRPRVHTLTIEITPIRDIHTGEISFLDFFEKTSEVVRALRGLPCQFIEILINTGGGNQERIRLNMKYAANIRRAKRGQEDAWENDRVMQSYRSAQAGDAQQSLDSLSVMIQEVWEGPNGRFVGGLNSDESDEHEDYF